MTTNTTSQSLRSKKFSPLTVLAGILVIVLLCTVPLVLVQDSEFGGSDGAGSEVVARMAPEYDSEWITNWWSPPGGETESMLFALQAAVGGICIGYCFGYLRGQRQTERTD